MSKIKPQLPVIGWREWISLEDFHVPKIKAKIDTGAKTCSLHAENIKLKKIGRVTYVYFDLFPKQHSKSHKRVKTKLIDERYVKDTGGKKALRPVVKSKISLGEYKWDVEITLSDRAKMVHEFLLARTAIKNRFLVNVGKSFLIGKEKK